MSWYLRKRLPAIERFKTSAAQVQREQLARLLHEAESTELGQEFDFKNIRSHSDYTRRIPVSNYDDFKPYIQKMLNGQQNIIWPTEVHWFAKSSGTTSDKSKYIPVTYENLDECHFQGGKDAMLFYLLQYPESTLFDGKGLIIGGSHTVNNLGNESFSGDLSAVMMQNMPFWAHYLRTPDLSIALHDNWDEKVIRMAEATLKEKVTSISGVPTWTLVLIEKLFEITGKKDIHEIWPDLELYLHGGVSFTPYKEKFQKLSKKPLHFLETYNASEGFFSIQDRAGADDMLLMLDYGIYYEFMPLEELGKPFPQTLTLDEVELDENYAIIISSSAGLWRYIVGDTIRFTSRNPYRIRVSGRTKHFINAFGEELMIENADFAIGQACKETQSSIIDYTAAPIYFKSESADPGGHEWIIEFDQHPDNIQQFTTILDNSLKQANSDYEAKRYKDMAMAMPKLHIAPKGTFHAWLLEKKKLGGQHKIPRLSNSRDFVDELIGRMK